MKVCSIFSQVLKLFSRGEFETAVRASSWPCCFAKWDAPFLARDLRRSASCEGQLKHLGVPLAPKRSTLAYANEHRPWELFQTAGLP